MKIAIIGTGRMGATLIRKLSAAGHAVRIANSRGPDTIQALAQETGTTAMTSAEAVQDVLERGGNASPGVAHFQDIPVGVFDLGSGQARH